MSRLHNRTIKLVCCTGVLALACASLGHAAPTLTISDGKQKDTVTVTDVNGLISFDGKVGEFTLSLSTTPASGLDLMPLLTLDSLTYGKKQAGTLTISLSDTSVNPTDGTIASRIDGHTSGSVSYTTFGDAGNSLFGKGTMLSTQGNLTGNAFTGSGSGTFSTGSPFSLTETFIIQESKGGNTAFGATVVDPPGTNGDVVAINDGPTSVPDTGSTIALLGFSVLGVEVVRRNLKPMQPVRVRAKFRY